MVTLISYGQPVTEANMTSNLSVFEFSSSQVRIVMIDREPWFAAPDVLRALSSSTKMADLKAMIEEDLGMGWVTNLPIQDAMGRTQNTTFLSEPALTLFVARSRTELGKAMNRWIHAEVLSEIRKSR